MKDIKRLYNCIVGLSCKTMILIRLKKRKLNVHKKILLELNKVVDR